MGEASRRMWPGIVATLWVASMGGCTDGATFGEVEDAGMEGEVAATPDDVQDDAAPPDPIDADARMAPETSAPPAAPDIEAPGDAPNDDSAADLVPDVRSEDAASPEDAPSEVAETREVDAEVGPDPEPECVPDGPACHLLGGPWPSKTTYPVVLVHGMAGWDDVGPYEYYFGVADHLRDRGHGVFVAVMDPFNSSPVRAGQLAGFVDDVLGCTCAERVNLVAHSQGGIDSRYLISAMGYGDRVASLTTIATPHRGVPIGDVALGLSDGPQSAVLDALAGFLGGLYTDPQEDANVADSLFWISTTGVGQFSAEWADDDRVIYRSWAGISGWLTPISPACDGAEEPPPKRGDALSPLLYPVWLVAGGNFRPSDGLVPVSSARWGRFRGCIAADHLDQIGQIAGVTGGFDYLGFYRNVFDTLAAEGL